MISFAFQDVKRHWRKILHVIEEVGEEYGLQITKGNCESMMIGMKGVNNFGDVTALEQ